MLAVISPLGCPRNNQIFFWFEPKRTETQSVSVVFRFVSAKPNKFFFGLFRCFGPVSKQPKQTETNRKNLQKTNLYQDVLETINFFSVRTETNRNSTCFTCFSVGFFRETKPNFFRLFWTGIETTKTNRTNCMEN
jgi:hypothetical protein